VVLEGKRQRDANQEKKFHRYDKENDSSKETSKETPTEEGMSIEEKERYKLLSVTAEDALFWSKKRRRRPWVPLEKHDQQTHYLAIKKRIKKNLEPSNNANGNSTSEYEKAKATQPDFYRDANSLNYATGVQPPSAQNLDKMVHELNETIAKRDQFSRRRVYYEEADIDYINERNRNFNKKIARAFDPYTTEIKLNLERGTAI